LAEKGNAKAEALLAGPPLPTEISYLWDWYLELDYAKPERPHPEANIPGLTYFEIKAWAELSYRNPEWFEVETLFDIDRAMRFPPPKDTPDDDGEDTE
jgi:hypothetical protein